MSFAATATPRATNRVASQTAQPTRTGQRLFVQPRRTFTFWKPKADDLDCVFASCIWASEKDRGTTKVHSTLYVLDDGDIQDKYSPAAYKMYLVPGSQLTVQHLQDIDAGKIAIFALANLKRTSKGDVMEFQIGLGRSTMFFSRGDNNPTLGNVQTDLLAEQKYLDFLTGPENVKNLPIPAGLAKEAEHAYEISRSHRAPVPAAEPAPDAQLDDTPADPETSSDIPF